MNRGLHQHDLTPAAAASFVATAGVRKSDAVLEVGAGRGNLAAALLKAGARVTALEIDAARAAELQKRFAGNSDFTLIAGDALQVVPAMPAGWRVVANPPFNLTAPLFKRWLTHDWPSGPPRALDLLLQHQAALKLTPQPGAYTRSSVLSALFGEARVSKKLPRDAVAPPSHVPLAGWSLKRHPDAPGAAELARVDALLADGFSGVHRMRDGLRKRLTGLQLKRQAEDHGWRLDDHPRTVAPAAWRAIAEFLNR